MAGKKSDIGVKISLEGEKEFKNALTQITAALKVNKSEQTLITAVYGKNATSMEALTEKSKALQNAIANQTKRVELLGDALKKATQETGETSKGTMKLQSDYNNARAVLANMNGQLGECRDGMEKTTQKSSALAGAINGIASIAGIQIPSAMQTMIERLDKVSVSGAVLTGVLSGTVIALGKMTISTAKTADDILTLSSTTGLSTDAIQEFAYASELLDVSSETMQSSMTKMIRTMGSARDGSKEAAAAYQRLGIHVAYSDGSLRDASTVFYETIDALGKMGNETERDALSMSIFGKSAQDLNPLIEAGSGKLRELADEAHNVGYVMSGENLDKFGQLDDVMQRMSTQTDTLKNSLALALLPILTALFGAISKIPVPVLQTLVVLASVVTTIILAIKAIKEITSTGSAIKGFFSGFGGSAAKTTVIVLSVVAALIAFVAMIVVLTGKTDELERAADSISGTMDSIKGNVYDAQNSVRNMPAYATGTKSAASGWAMVGEEGPEIVRFRGGETVFPAGESRMMMSGNSGNTRSVEIGNLTINPSTEQWDQLMVMLGQWKNTRQQRRAR